MSLQGMASTGATSNVCVICLENLQSEAIGTCVPCGHCFHVQCFMEWKESKRNTGSTSTPKIKCPTCNTISKNFCRLFLDLEKLTCTENNENDDNTTSSSDSETNTSEDNDNDDDDDDDNKCDTTDPISLLDTDTIDDNVIDLCQEDNNNHNNNTTTNSHMKRKRKRRSTMSASTSTDNILDSGNKKVTKYKQKIKKLQQLLTQSESKSRQFIDSNKKLLEMHQSHIDDKTTFENEMKQLQERIESVSNSCDSLRRTNEYINLECVQSRARAQTAITNLENEQKRSSQLQEQIAQLEQKLVYETKRARATSMNEVKTLLEKYPKLVNENNILKIDNNKKLEEIKNLRNKLGGKDVSSSISSSSLFDRRILATNSNNNDKNRNPSIKVAKMLTSLNEQYENGKNSSSKQHYSQSIVVPVVEQQQQQQQQQVAASSTNNLPKKFSSYAARISRASNEQRCQMTTILGIDNRISNDKIVTNTTDRHQHHSNSSNNNNNVSDFMCSLIQQPPKNQITNFFSKQRKR